MKNAKTSSSGERQMFAQYWAPVNGPLCQMATKLPPPAARRPTRTARVMRNVAGAKDEGGVDGRAHPDGHEDLRDGELEAEHRLPEHLEGQDHGRQAQARVAPAGQDNGNAPSADHDRAPSCWWGRRHASDGGQRCPPGPLDDAGTTVINGAVRGSAARQRKRCGVARTR